jgi:hypothetical protein
MSVSEQIRRLCEEVVAWQKDENVQCIPKSKTNEDRERKLGVRFAQALRRRVKAVGTKLCNAVLNDEECVLINRIPGVPAQGRSIPVEATVAGVERQVDAGNSTCRRRKVELSIDMASKRRCTKISIIGDVMNKRSRGRTDRVPLRSSKMLGGVQSHGLDGWRFAVNIDGKRCVGPVRRNKVDAEADMREAKEARTRVETKTRTREIKVRARTIAGTMATPHIRKREGRWKVERKAEMVLTITTENMINGKINVCATSRTGQVLYVESYEAQDGCRRTAYYSNLKDFLIKNKFSTKSTTIIIVDIDGKNIRRNLLIKEAIQFKKKNIKKKASTQSLSQSEQLSDGSMVPMG